MDAHLHITNWNFICATNTKLTYTNRSPDAKSPPNYCNNLPKWSSPLINRSTSRKKKKIIMVTPFAGSYGMAMSFFSHPLAASSSRWTVQGFSWAILFNDVNWLRKKWISKLIDFILFFRLLSTRLPRNWSDRAPLNVPVRSRILS